MYNFSVFRQTPLHDSGVSAAHHQEVQRYGYNIWYLLLSLGDCLLSWTTDSLVFLDDGLLSRTTGSHLKRNNKYQFLYTHGCTS